MRIRFAMVAATVVAVSCVTSAASAKPKPGGSGGLQFAGYNWVVKSSTAPVGPGPNVFSSSGPYIDSAHHLHLQIQDQNGTWTSSEVYNSVSLGYGTYTWTVQGPLTFADPNDVLGLFNYDSSASPDYREIDIEASQWGDAASTTNADYAVEPGVSGYPTTNFSIPASSTVTLSFTWTAGKIVFSGHTTTSGHNTPLQSFTVTGPYVPTPGSQVAHMNLWLHQGTTADAYLQPLDVTILGFTFRKA